MRNFFRYMKQIRDPALADKPLDAIDIRDIDLAFLRAITLTDIYGYMTYLSRERVQHQHSENSNNGLNAASRARKLATIRSFFNYICNKRHLLEDNPCKDVDTPKQMKALPRYLTLNESLSLLDAVDGPNRERDYCILTLLLNCGLRRAELAGLNLNDVRGDHTLRVIGKGNKERILYLNEACQKALEVYLPKRPVEGTKDKKALFYGHTKDRISVQGVHYIVKGYLKQIPGAEDMSTHKLRHTAATLMYQQGGVDVLVLKEILGHKNLGTTQIYTHLSSEQLEKAAAATPLAGVSPQKKQDST